MKSREKSVVKFSEETFGSVEPLLKSLNQCLSGVQTDTKTCSFTSFTNKVMTTLAISDALIFIFGSLNFSNNNRRIFSSTQFTASLCDVLIKTYFSGPSLSLCSGETVQVPPLISSCGDSSLKSSSCLSLL